MRSLYQNDLYVNLVESMIFRLSFTDQFCVQWCSHTVDVFVYCCFTLFILIVDRGQTPAEADFNLLDTARKIELYGIRVHPAKVSNTPSTQKPSTHTHTQSCTESGFTQPM